MLRIMPHTLKPAAGSTARAVERLAFILLGLILLIRYPIHDIKSPPFLMDFTVYRAIGQRMMTGQGVHLYDPTVTEMMIFKYAPPWAFVFLPFSWLPEHAAAVLWIAVEVCCLLLTLALLMRLCRTCGLSVHPLTAVVTVLLLVRPLAEELGNGQSNLLWGLLVTGFLYGLATKRSWPTACLLAAAILLKLPAAIFLPYLALKHHAKIAVRTLLVMSLAVLLSSLVLAPTAFWELPVAWARALFRNGQAYAFMIGNQSVLALLGRYLTADGYGLNIVSLSRPALPWVLLVLGSIAFFWVSGPATRDHVSPQRVLHDSALLTIIMTIFSPSCFLATYMMLVVPIGVALASLWHDRRRQPRDPLILMAGSLVVGGSVLMKLSTWRLLGLRAWHGEAYLYLVFMVLPWMGLALFALLLRQRALSCR